MDNKIQQTQDEYMAEWEQQFEERKKNYKGPHCCYEMHTMVEKNEANVSPVFYKPEHRDYYLKATHGLGGGTIAYCPMCGVKLLRPLTDDWFDILEKEYSIEFPSLPKEHAKIPSEFLTDEWWKKRGL